MALHACALGTTQAPRWTASPSNPRKRGGGGGGGRPAPGCQGWASTAVTMTTPFAVPPTSTMPPGTPCDARKDSFLRLAAPIGLPPLIPSLGRGRHPLASCHPMHCCGGCLGQTSSGRRRAGQETASAPQAGNTGKGTNWTANGTADQAAHGSTAMDRTKNPERLCAPTLASPPCVTFRLVVAPLQCPGRSPVRPFACCVGSLRSVGRCGRCSCWCRFRIRGAQ